jgi:uncharacterized protein (TIGR04255 family)
MAKKLATGSPKSLPEGRKAVRRYRNPPIQEALCEVRFEPGSETDFAAPGRFFEKVRASYPGKPRQHQVVATAFQVGTDQANPRMSMQQQGVTLVLFPSEDGLRLVGLGQNILTVHDLRPYSGWERFRPRIEAALRAYEEVDKPKGIRHIALRYINRVNIRSPKVCVGDYLTLVPQLPKAVPATISGFLSRLEGVFADRPFRLILNVATLPPENQEETAFLLDIEVRQEWTEETLPLSKAISHIDELRDRERSAFEAFITDRAREVFNAD